MIEAAPVSQEATVARPLSGDQAGPQIEVLDVQCVLIRNLLTIEDQSRLFEYIQHHDKTPTNLPRAMVPAPKTLLLGEDGHPSIRYSFGEESVVNEMVGKGAEVLRTQGLNVMDGFDVCQYRSLSMATIRYEVPNGHFPAHVDHCNDSFVFLTSLGCTANFMVKGPNMDAQKHFKFCSGDMLVFNASSEAALLHAVMSIDEAGSEVDELLGSTFPSLRDYRYGVQCRMYF